MCVWGGGGDLVMLQMEGNNTLFKYDRIIKGNVGPF